MAFVHKFVAITLMIASITAQAAVDVSVYPIKGVFINEVNDKAQTAISPEFVTYLNDVTKSELAASVKLKLDTAFESRVTQLNAHNASSNYAVSFHITRASLYKTPKADGNYEIRAPITASIFFTNVLTGEILFTVTSTFSTVATIAPTNGLLTESELNTLYTNSLNGLIADLVYKATSEFQPKAIEVKVNKIDSGLIYLSGGFRNGIQTGDSLDDENSNLIRVIYSGENYSVAQPVIASDVKDSQVFRKFVLSKIDGKPRPRVSVMMENAPSGFGVDYLTELFGEELGSRAPLSMVLINKGFSSLVKTVVQQAELSSKLVGQRDTPDLLIKLSVPEPIMTELQTNLKFKTKREFISNVFAEVVDSSGRVLLSTSNSERQSINVTGGLDLDPNSRKEIVIKNALIGLAEKLSNQIESKIERLKIDSVTNGDLIVSTGGKNYPLRQSGFLLKKASSSNLLIPNSEGYIDAINNDRTLRVAKLMPFVKSATEPSVGDIFEMQLVGAVPSTSNTFSMCQDVVKLGTIDHPYYSIQVQDYLAKNMPGVFFDPSVTKLADDFISPFTGFSKKMDWKIITPEFCIEPVHRIDFVERTCTEFCQSSMNLRFTLRVKKDGEVVSKYGLEKKIKSSGYVQGESEPTLKNLLSMDIAEETAPLLDSITTKLNFNPQGK